VTGVHVHECRLRIGRLLPQLRRQRTRPPQRPQRLFSWRARLLTPAPRSSIEQLGKSVRHIR